MHSFLLFFATFALLPAAVLLAPCPMDTCPCIRRGVFDSAWLTANNPTLAEQNNNYVFSAPNVTYPNCTSIIATCPSTAQMAQLKSGNITVGGVLLKNPLVFQPLICDENHNWRMVGYNQPMDANLLTANISCATKV